MLPATYYLRTCDDALAVAKQLQEKGYTSILHPLDANYLHCIEQMTAKGNKGSIALRHPFDNLDAICDAAKKASIPLEMDMRQVETIDETLQAYERVRSILPETTLCIQAYLKRSREDISKMRPAAVRIVKGAFGAQDSYRTQETKENFLALAQYCKENNIPAKIATHDQCLMQACVEMYENTQVKPEFQFMYGMHEGQGKALLDKGFSVAAYLMYGTPKEMLKQLTFKNLRSLLR